MLLFRSTPISSAGDPTQPDPTALGRAAEQGHLRRSSPPRILVVALKAHPASAPPSDLSALVKCIEQHWPDARLTLLTAGQPTFLGGREVELWTDGAMRGAGAWLSLARRIVWGQFDAVYDVSPNLRSKLLKWTVKPCPPWHKWAINHP